MGGAEGDTAMAIDALALISFHTASGFIKRVNLICALSFAHPAGDASILVSYYLKVRIQVVDAHLALLADYPG